MEQPSVDEFFQSAPSWLDVDSIRREWVSLPSAYRVDDRRLPVPVWARRGLTETAEEAWEVLRWELARIEAAKPLCIYVHIPFCASRCSFCDCYSFALRRNRGKHVEAYLVSLTQEMRLWSRQGTLANRPVSTVHFGGGTPTFLGEEHFSRLVHALRQNFHIGPDTEWALESTSSELTSDMLSALDCLGFTRLHVGVQSLQEGVRRMINRRESGSTVMRKITQAADLGWVVSVDLILGLPGQSLTGALGDVDALERVGVDGFSLYELQLSPHNHAFTERYGLADRSRLIPYFLAQAVSRRLAGLGYKKTLFNHFARAHDANLYFTFPERGEDCLALGTIADGVFGDYHYRHPKYKPYTRAVGASLPGLEGGLRRSSRENRLQPLEVAILSATLCPELFGEVLGRDQSEALLRGWREGRLVEEASSSRCLRLTTNGSWFVSEMMAELWAR